MAGGPKLPDSIDYSLLAGRVFPNTHAVTTNNHQHEGVGVEASLGADVDIQLEFLMPASLPTGTAKLVVEAMADATSGIATLNPRWKTWAPEEDRDVAKTTYPTAEGESTVTWASGDDHVVKQNKIDLDAETIVAGETIHMYLQLIQASSKWTLAQVSTWKFYIIWE